MADQADLQEKIARLAGQINQKKQQKPNGHHPSPSPWRGSPRWSPYGPSQKSIRGGFVHPVKNLTLVNHPSTASAPIFDPIPTQTPKNFATSNTHQLMTTDVYDREKKHKEQLRAAKRQRVDQKERAELKQHAPGQALVEEIRFQLRQDQSKLIRVNDPSTIHKQTPKAVKYGGFNFLRTKHGNLVRANAIKGLPRYLTALTRHVVADQDLLPHPSRTNVRKQTPQCEHFTKHGTCPFGRSCHFAHDPEKVAICPAYLKGQCPAGEYCDLSHAISSNRVATCFHFLRGNCTNDACRYPHVYVSPSASICRPFARLGYCANEACDKRHVIECPDNDNAMGCTNPKCSLPHPDRAHVLRKAAAKQAKISSEDASDVSSDEEDSNEIGFEDIDSDEAEDVMMGGVDDDNHELSQQADYVSFA